MNTPTRFLPALGKPGRLTKFTPECRARLLKLVAAGVPYNHACRVVRISFSAFCNYRDRNPDFREEMEQAVSAAIEKRLAKIEAASDAGDWRASSWLLEHIFPADFSKTRIEVTGADGAPLAGQIQILLPAKDGTAPPTVIVEQPKEIADAD